MTNRKSARNRRKLHVQPAAQASQGQPNGGSQLPGGFLGGLLAFAVADLAKRAKAWPSDATGPQKDQIADLPISDLPPIQSEPDEEIAQYRAFTCQVARREWYGMGNVQVGIADHCGKRFAELRVEERDFARVLLTETEILRLIGMLQWARAEIELAKTIADMGRQAVTVAQSDCRPNAAVPHDAWGYVAKCHLCSRPVAFDTQQDLIDAGWTTHTGQHWTCPKCDAAIKAAEWPNKGGFQCH